MCVLTDDIFTCVFKYINEKYYFVHMDEWMITPKLNELS